MLEGKAPLQWGQPLESCSLGNEAGIAAANEGAQTGRCRLPFYSASLSPEAEEEAQVGVLEEA